MIQRLHRQRRRRHFTQLPAPSAIIQPTRASIDSTLMIQSFLRRLKACQTASLVVEKNVIQCRREARARWEKGRAIQKAIEPLRQEQIAWHANLTSEIERIDSETTKEQQQFNAKWETYRKTLLKTCMKNRISDDWVPQLEDSTGKRFYYNIRTGKCSSIHPNILFLLIYLLNCL